MATIDASVRRYTGPTRSSERQEQARENADRFLELVGDGLTESSGHWQPCMFRLWPRHRPRGHGGWRFGQCKCGGNYTLEIAPNWRHGLGASYQSEGIELDHTFTAYHPASRERVIVSQPYSPPLWTEPTNIPMDGGMTALQVWDLPQSASFWYPGATCLRIVATESSMSDYLVPQLKALA